MQFGGSHLKKKAPLFPARERWEGGRKSERDGMQASGPHDNSARVSSFITRNVWGGRQRSGLRVVAVMRAPE